MNWKLNAVIILALVAVVGATPVVTALNTSSGEYMNQSWIYFKYCYNEVATPTFADLLRVSINLNTNYSLTDQSLHLSYSFDSNQSTATKVVDESSGGINMGGIGKFVYNATVYGGNTTTPGRTGLGDAMQFDGVNQYMKTPNFINISAFTLSFWAKFNSLTDDKGLVSRWGNTTDVPPYSFTSYSNCYQETVTTATGCGGLNTGAYLFAKGSGIGNWTSANAIDGNWGNAAAGPANSTPAFLFINYSTPNNATSAIWMMKMSDENGTNQMIVNYSIPTNCFNVSNKVQLRWATTRENPTDTNATCWNSASWTNIFLYADLTPVVQDLWEEGMHWNMTGNTTYENVTSCSTNASSSNVSTTANMTFNYSSYTNNPIIIKGGRGVFAPTMIYEEGVLHMWLGDAFVSGQDCQISYTNSTDGITFSPLIYVLNYTSANGSAYSPCYPSVFKNGSTYYMTTTLLEGSGANFSNIHVWSSTDRIHWSKFCYSGAITSGSALKFNSRILINSTTGHADLITEWGDDWKLRWYTSNGGLCAGNWTDQGGIIDTGAGYPKQGNMWYGFKNGNYILYWGDWQNNYPVPWNAYAAMGPTPATLGSRVSVRNATQETFTDLNYCGSPCYKAGVVDPEVVEITDYGYGNTSFLHPFYFYYTNDSAIGVAWDGLNRNFDQVHFNQNVTSNTTTTSCLNDSSQYHSWAVKTWFQGPNTNPHVRFTLRNTTGSEATADSGVISSTAGLEALCTAMGYSCPNVLNWHYYTAKANGTHATMCIDAKCGSPSFYGNINTTTADLVIGHYLNTTNSFNGSIDEVKIWNRSLSDAEIQFQHNNTPHYWLSWNATGQYVYLELNYSNVTKGNYTHQFTVNSSGGTTSSGLSNYQVHPSIFQCVDEQNVVLPLRFNITVSNATGSYSIYNTSYFQEVRQPETSASIHYLINEITGAYAPGIFNFLASTPFNFTCYLSTTAAKTLVYVLDENKYKVVGAYVEVRKVTAEGSNLLMGTGSTDSEGKLLFYLQPYTETYQFNVTFNNQTNQVGNTIVACTNGLCPPYIVTLNVRTTPAPEFFRLMNQINTSCAVNASDFLVCSVNDASGLVSRFNLLVEKKGNIIFTTHCNQTVVASSGTLYCNLGNETNTFFRYKVSYFASPETTNVWGYIDRLTGLFNWGVTGIVLAFFLVLTLFFAGVFNPSIAVIMGYLGIVASWLLGLLPADFGALIGLGVAVGILVWRMGI